jgi:hypothetical protein
MFTVYVYNAILYTALYIAHLLHDEALLAPYTNDNNNKHNIK